MVLNPKRPQIDFPSGAFGAAAAFPTPPAPPTPRQGPVGCCCGDCEIDPCMCCVCLPAQHCVTIKGEQYGCSCDDEGATEIFVFDGDRDVRSWHGVIECGDGSYDLEYWFAKRDGVCNLVLRSTCLGFPEGYELWTPVECPDCGRDLFVEITGLAIGECGEAAEGCETVTLTIRAADILDRSDLAETVCPDCLCIANCLCVSIDVLGDPPGTTNQCRQSKIVCMVERPETGGLGCSEAPSNTWEWSFECRKLDGDILFSGEASVTIENGSNGCEAVLRVPGLDIEERAVIGCPAVSVGARRSLADGDELPEGISEVRIGVSSVSCGECEGVRTPCCPDVDLPRNLTATIEQTVNCDNLEGVEIPLTLISEDPVFCWAGSVTVPNLEGTCQISACLCCTGPEATFWKLALGSSEAECEGGTNPDEGEASCDPIELVFDDQNTTGCCLPYPVAGQFKVRVTE